MLILFDWIDIVVGEYHGQGVFCLPIKLIYIMDDKEIFEREAHIDYTYCREDNGVILKNTIITKLGESFNKLLHYF